MPTLVYRSYVGHRTGYGLAAHQDILALATAGADFRVCGLSGPPPQFGWPIFGRSMEAARQRYDRNAWKDRCTQVLRAIPTDALAPIEPARSDRGFPVRFHPGQKAICFTVFEAPNWPRGWVTASNLYDAISVPGEWLAVSARAAGVKTRIEVIPHAMDFEEADRQEHEHIQPQAPPGEAWWEAPTGEESVRILTQGTYMLRKNIPALVEAFYRAGFDRKDAVLLVHTHYFKERHRSLLMEQLYQVRKKLHIKCGDAPPVVVSDAALMWDTLWAMFRWATVYATAAYAEGVGYPLIMAAGLGIPIVCTDQPGHFDTAPHAIRVTSAAVMPADLWDRDPMAMMDDFRIAHVFDEDRWFAPSRTEMAQKLRLATSDVSRSDALVSAVGVRNRHGLAPVGKQILDLVEGV